MENLKPEDLIPGEIYFHKTSYNWYFVFDKCVINHLYGTYNTEKVNGVMTKPNNKYGNSINYTVELRLATFEEREKFISCIQSEYPKYTYTPQPTTPTYEIY